MQFFWFWIVMSILFIPLFTPDSVSMTEGSAIPSRLTDPVPGSQLSKVGIVLPLGAPGSFDDGMVESPVIWFDEQRGK